jgi:hypothetical protein
VRRPCWVGGAKHSGRLAVDSGAPSRSPRRLSGLCAARLRQLRPQHLVLGLELLDCAERVLHQLFSVAHIENTSLSVSLTNKLESRCMRRGQRHSAEAREKIRQARLGTRHSEETKDRIGASVRARRATPETLLKAAIYDVEREHLRGR